MTEGERHAITRMRDRFGVEITDDDLEDLTCEAMEKGVIVHHRGASGTECRAVSWRGLSLRVILKTGGDPFIVTLHGAGGQQYYRSKYGHKKLRVKRNYTRKDKHKRGQDE